MTNFRGEVISSETITRGQRIINYLSTGKDDVVYFTDDNNLFITLNSKVNEARVESSKERNGVTSESLSHKWLISPKAARRKV